MPGLIIVVLALLGLVGLIGCLGLLVLEDPDRRPYGWAVVIAFVGFWLVSHRAGSVLSALFDRW
jgi:hypothetical protein